MEQKNEKIILKEGGGYTVYAPQEKRQVVVRVNIPPSPRTDVGELATRSAGEYCVMREITPQQVVPQPIANILELRHILKGTQLKQITGRYFEGTDGYYYNSNEYNFQRFTDFHMAIEAREIEVDISGKESHFLRVILRESTGKTRTIRVPEEDWKDLYERVEQKAPTCQFFTDEVRGVKEKFRCLAGFFLKGNIPERFLISHWGWGQKLSDGSRIFYHGGRTDCTSIKTLPPPAKDRSQAFCQGWRIFNVGDDAIMIPVVLQCLAAYTDALFTDAGYPLSHCAMLIGESGFLKTSLMRVIGAPFNEAKDRINSIRGTDASFRVLHEIFFDDILVVDDFNLEGTPADVKMKIKTMTELIRAYSDKSPRSKYGGNDNIKKYAIRGTCIFTGETQMVGQLKSCELRYIKIFFQKPLDKEKLSFFQENPYLIQNMFAEYIRHLCSYYINLVRWIQEEFPKRRQYINISEPRLRDAFIHLSITAELLGGVATNTGAMTEEFACKWSAFAEKTLYALISRQSNEAQQGEPYIRYIAEVWNLIGTGKVRIARTLKEFVSNIPGFMGYQDSLGLLIMKKDDLYRLVLDAFYARNESLPIGIDEISKKLKEAGLTKCDPDSCLIKASSKIPGRPRMLALIPEKCMDKIRKIGGN